MYISYTNMLKLCYPTELKIDLRDLILIFSYWKLVVHLLTYWSFLIGEKCGVVATIHVGHAYVVTISPVQLPKDMI